ncbi:hypothetical protein [Sandarakinorhabdus sp.]|uniref:hypothetical protein n=1 Tax=Sandarakinorhabdus sp. TaxID=1916663 RepID=UPI003F707CEB
MMALVTPMRGKAFHVWWDGAAFTDGRSKLARRAVAILNGELDLPQGIKHEGGTDGHAWERGRLRSRDDFLLTVGSLVDRLEGVALVELLPDA